MKRKNKIILSSGLLLNSFFSIPVMANLAITGPGASADGSSKSNGNISYNFIQDGNTATYWEAATPHNERISVKWADPVSVNRVVLREHGTNITDWRLVDHNSGTELASGSGIGNSRTFNFSPITTSKLNLEILNANGLPRISEFEVYNVSGNLALINSGADGSSKSNSNISYMSIIDNDRTTYWESQTTSNERISVKWNQAIDVNQVVIREMNDVVTSWRLVDHGTGTQLASGTSLGNARTINFTPIRSSKLNLEIISANRLPRIAEFEVYNTNGSSPVPDNNGGISADVCAASPTGYASLNGGTTGGSGSNAVTVTVSTGAQLANALKNRDFNRPLTIRVNGTITPANSDGLAKLDIKDMNNVSIIGVGNSALFDGIGLKIFRANNVIIRNVRVRYVNIGDKDAITIEGPARNIWIDHNELYNSLNVHKDYYDELISGKKDIDNITISYNYFHNSWKTSLWGSSDNDNFNRRITFHHNRWENVNSRLPLFRFGEGHIFNNYYKNMLESGINSRMAAVIRIENNVFEDAKNPIVSLYSKANGYWDLRGNQLDNVSWSNTSDGIIAGPEMQSTATLNLPYNFSVLPANQVKDHVLTYAGVNKCNF
ncbi:pectate lyase family protein [Vibrio metschnikovii]|uniref:pectate lyase family protein n=1 Tax=Vibrio metschnikovii TaxID=28172 RepID=UPI001C2F85CE|nr:hypothetical protein [Vibrio metschnikovii]